MCSNTCRSCQTRQTAQQWGWGKINGVTCGPLDKLGCDSCRVKFVEVNEVRHGKVTCTCAQKRANQGKHVQKRARVHVLDFCTYARMHVPSCTPQSSSSKSSSSSSSSSSSDDGRFGDHIAVACRQAKVIHGKKAIKKTYAEASGGSSPDSLLSWEEYNNKSKLTRSRSWDGPLVSSSPRGKMYF
jgi:hypothetical protein